MNNYASYIDINSSVLKALQFGIPVVALDSSIMRSAANLDLILKVYDIIKEEEAVPAITAIIDGRIKIGLTNDELEYLCTIDNVLKIEKKDIPYAVALEKTGISAFSSTMAFSEIAGIKVFAAGKISGALDVQELSRTNLCVICSEISCMKGFDEIAIQLATPGVSMYSYSKSNIDHQYSIDSPERCAKVMKTKWDLNIDGSIVITNAFDPSKSGAQGFSSIKEISKLAAQIAAEYNKISCDY